MNSSKIILGPNGKPIESKNQNRISNFVYTKVLSKISLSKAAALIGILVTTATLLSLVISEFRSANWKSRFIIANYNVTQIDNGKASLSITFLNNSEKTIVLSKATFETVFYGTKGLPVPTSKINSGYTYAVPLSPSDEVIEYSLDHQLLSGETDRLEFLLHGSAGRAITRNGTLQMPKPTSNWLIKVKFLCSEDIERGIEQFTVEIDSRSVNNEVRQINSL